jgi:hypothetical protein
MRERQNRSQAPCSPQERFNVRQDEIATAPCGAVVETGRRYKLGAGDLGSALPCWIVDRIGSSSVADGHPVVPTCTPRDDARGGSQGRVAEGHREAAPRVLDGREHGGSLAAEGRRPITGHIAVYPRKLTAANKCPPTR